MRAVKVGPCSICNAANAKSHHFGVKSCKACAAFFRRTIALNVKYTCKKGSTCVISFDQRYMCKQCRLIKCRQLGMMEELVESKGKMSERNKIQIEMPVSVPTTPEPSCSKDDLERVTNHYVKIESALNDRRRIAFCDITIKDVLYGSFDCPYEFEDLTPYDYKNYMGYANFEFGMVFDYVRSFLEYESITKSDQNVLFRFGAAVDSVMCGAYYTIRKGMEKKVLVSVDCTYYPMDPLPPTGDEPDCPIRFESEAELMRYKSLVSPKRHQWSTLVLPLQKLNPSFAEFALLKALVCWHVCYYKFHPRGQEVCMTQRNQIMQALFSIAEKNEKGSGVTRTGEMLLYISAVFEQVYDLLEALYMIKIFDIVKMDDFISDLLDQERECLSTKVSQDKKTASPTECHGEKASSHRVAQKIKKEGKGKKASTHSQGGGEAQKVC